MIELTEQEDSIRNEQKSRTLQRSTEALQAASVQLRKLPFGSQEV